MCYKVTVRVATISILVPYLIAVFFLPSTRYIDIGLFFELVPLGALAAAGLAVAMAATFSAAASLRKNRSDGVKRLLRIAVICLAVVLFVVVDPPSESHAPWMQMYANPIIDGVGMYVIVSAG